jgi:hypothetical protein
MIKVTFPYRYEVIRPQLRMYARGSFRLDWSGFDDTCDVLFEDARDAVFFTLKYS